MCERSRTGSPDSKLPDPKCARGPCRALATTHNALQRVGRLKVQADGVRLKTLSDMKALAGDLDGSKVAVAMRAGAGGRLYGSVTSAMIAERLSESTDRVIDRRTVTLLEPIRELGLFEVNLHLHQEAEARISVLVHATGTDPDELFASLEEADDKPSDPEEGSDA